MMGKKEFKNLIFQIFEKHLSPIEQYKVFLFGVTNINENVQTDSVDIGIDTGDKIDFLTLSKIQCDLDVIPSLQKIYLIDFYRISGKLREIAIKTAEVLN